MAPVAQRISHCFARLTTRCAGYVSDGLTEEQYNDIKIRDSRSRQRKDLGSAGTLISHICLICSVELCRGMMLIWQARCLVCIAKSGCPMISSIMPGLRKLLSR
eukprot:11793-Heterococcus_DN1.PRE.1